MKNGVISLIRLETRGVELHFDGRLSFLGRKLWNLDRKEKKGKNFF